MKLHHRGAGGHDIGTLIPHLEPRLPGLTIRPHLFWHTWQNLILAPPERTTLRDIERFHSLRTSLSPATALRTRYPYVFTVCSH